MSKEMTVIVLGLLVLVTPFLGIPGSWKTIILILAGLVLAGVGFLLRGETLARGTHAAERHFVENQAPQSYGQTQTQPPVRDHGIGSLN